MHELKPRDISNKNSLIQDAPLKTTEGFVSSIKIALGVAGGILLAFFGLLALGVAAGVAPAFGGLLGVLFRDPQFWLTVLLIVGGAAAVYLVRFYSRMK